MSLSTFNQILSRAVRDIAERGYTDADRISKWTDEIRRAALAELGPDERAEFASTFSLDAIFKRLFDRGRITDYVPGVTRYTLEIVKPKARAELDRRILASADLIKLRRRESIEGTLARFAGWSTSIPPGGANVIDLREVRANIAKPLARERYERRRVLIDQGHKLLANVNHIVAAEAGAIAGEWHDHGEHDPSYNARQSHMDRTGKIYLMRGSWALERGYIRPMHGYMDDMTAPGEEVFCRCFYRYITSPRRLPDEFLTEKGREWIRTSALQAMAQAA